MTIIKLQFNLKFMEIKKIQTIIFCLFFLTIISCSVKHHDDKSDHDIKNNELILLSPSQYVHAGIKTACLEKRIISGVVLCDGTVIANPNKHAYASVPMNGYLKKILTGVRFWPYLNILITLICKENSLRQKASTIITKRILKGRVS